MATDEQLPVKQEDLLTILVKLRDVRAWAVHNEADPWAFRQALITVMAIDTAAALERGVKNEDLARFDELACTKAETLVMEILQEGRSRVR